MLLVQAAGAARCAQYSTIGAAVHTCPAGSRREGGRGDGSPNAPPRRHDRVMRECGGGLRPGKCRPDAHGARAEPRAEERKD